MLIYFDPIDARRVPERGRRQVRTFADREIM